MSVDASDTESNGHIGIGQVDNLAAIIERMGERIRELEGRVAELERDDRAGRLRRVVEHADRLSRGSEVAMNYSEVMAAAGVSAPTAYAYMDDLVANHDRVRRDLHSPSDVKRIIVEPPR